MTRRKLPSIIILDSHVYFGVLDSGMLSVVSSRLLPYVGRDVKVIVMPREFADEKLIKEIRKLVRKHVSKKLKEKCRLLEG